MGFFSKLFDPLGLVDKGKNLFKQKEIPQNLDTRNPDVKRVQGSLADFITKYLPEFRPGEPYTGTRSAPISSFETEGLGYLQQFLDQPDMSNLLPAAGAEVMDTLTGEYDPSTSQFYKSMRDAAMIEREDAQDRLNQSLGARRKYFSSEAIKEGRELDTRTTNYLQGILGGLSEAERERRLQVLPEARAINDAIIQAPLKKTTAALTYGALPRQLQQEDLERAYEEFVRQRSEKAIPVNAALGFDTGNPLSFRAYDKSPFERYIMPLLNTAIQAGTTAAMSGCWVAAEIFGGWEHPKTVSARRYVNRLAPAWFKDFYLKYGQKLAEIVRIDPSAKERLRPLFEAFARKGGYVHGNA